MSLNNDIFNAIIAKMMKEGDTIDLAKLMLSREEHLQVAQRYFSNLEADKKTQLQLDGDLWFLGPERYDIKPGQQGLPLFQKFATSIIPFVKELVIKNTHFEDYSFLNDIKNLEELSMEFTDDEYIIIFSSFTNLQSVGKLNLHITDFHLQFLHTLNFICDWMSLGKITFEAEPEYDPILQAHYVLLCGDDDLKNDFVFTRQNYEKYAAIFPNAISLNFGFHMRVDEDLTDFLKVTKANYVNEVLENNLSVNFTFYDYSGFPDSEVFNIIKSQNNWNVARSPYEPADREHLPISIDCFFPLANENLDQKLAKNYIPRIPVDSHGNPEDYYHLTITFGMEREVEFEVLKSITVTTFLEAYAGIVEMDLDDIHFYHNYHLLYHHGIVADKFQDGDKIRCYYGWVNYPDSDDDF